MGHRGKSASRKYTLRYAAGVANDLVALRARNPVLLDSALAALDDLLHGRQRGKVLGDRRVTGDLSGLARLRFDLPDERRRRYRIVYRIVDGAPATEDVIEVLAVGERADHAVYRDALTRLNEE